jgi:hypothetical protein
MNSQYQRPNHRQDFLFMEMINMKSVFVITTVTDTGGGRNDRAVGIYTNFESAREAVMENYGDINENGHYKYAVIEEHYTNVIYGVKSSGKRDWFVWNGDSYLPVETPDEFKKIIAWGIG